MRKCFSYCHSLKLHTLLNSLRDLLLLLHLAHEKTIGILYLMEEVVVVIKDSLDLFKWKVEDHASDLTNELVADDLLDVFIDKVANHVLHVFVVGSDCGYETVSL